MDFFSRIFAFILSVIISFFGISFETPSKRAEDFRVVAYVVGDSFSDKRVADYSHFEDITDVILIGVSDFDTEGNIILKPDFSKAYENLREAMEGTDGNLYLNIIGPGYETESTVWEEQMDDLASHHDMAFRSGNLEGNIKAVLDEYDFDGIMFDYEYPLTKEHWNVFDNFLISLDKVLGDEYKIGCAISAWNTLQSKKAIKVLDLVEVMSYDMWDNDGTHSSLLNSEECINKMLLNGYRKEQLDMGIPFYARPTTQEGYWYAYNGWYDKLDDKGMVFDEETGLTFSFNTYDMVYRKTQWAINEGLGGVMIWHYSCDLPKENSLSLFNAIADAKAERIAAYTRIGC